MLMLLNILKLSIINFYKELPKYYYKELEELRYIYIEKEDIKISTKLEEINYTREDNIIDLNNYYPIDSLIIETTNDYIKLFNNKNDNFYAYCTNNNNIITVDNCTIYNPKWNIVKSNNLLKETKYRIKL